MADEKAKNPWRELLANPISIAVVGGMITLMTTVVANYFNTREASRTEVVRAKLADASAKEALQADLIKKFVENPNSGAVRQNLQFLVEAGLIPTYADGIKKYLEAHPDAAPHVGGGVEFSSSGVALAADVKERIQQAVDRFEVYLQNLGFSNLEKNVSVFIYSKDKPPPNVNADSANVSHLGNAGADSPNAFYVDKTIYIHEALAGDISIALREYSHHALFVSAGSPTAYHQTAVESAIADYLPASFSNSPIIGAGLGSIFGLSTSDIRTLDSNVSYSASPTDPATAGKAWAATLWACRGRVGAQSVDRIILPAWREAMSGQIADDLVLERFQKSLMDAPPPLGACFAKEFASRNFPKSN